MSDIPLQIESLERSIGNLRSLLADSRFTPQLDDDALGALLAEKGLAEEKYTLDEWREMASKPECGEMLAEDVEIEFASLRHQLRNQLCNQLAGHVDPPAAPPRRKPRVRGFEDVQPLATRWIWPHRVARGWLTLLAGESGAGKSLVLIDLISRVSRGTPFPADNTHRRPGRPGRPNELHPGD